MHTQRCLPFEILEELAQTPSLTLCPHLSLPLRVSSAEEIRGQRASLHTLRASLPHGQAQTPESTPFLRAPPQGCPCKARRRGARPLTCGRPGGSTTVGSSDICCLSKLLAFSLSSPIPSSPPPEKTGVGDIFLPPSRLCSLLLFPPSKSRLLTGLLG